MILEKSFRPLSGYMMLLLCLLCIGIGIVGISQRIPAIIVPSFLLFAFLMPGFMIINPNESRVLTLFGKYNGTVKENGFFWVNPFFVKRMVSLRAFNLNGQSLKVNDKTGNPIDIAAVIVWQVQETAKAIFEVNDLMFTFKAKLPFDILRIVVRTTIGKITKQSSHCAAPQIKFMKCFWQS